MAVIDYQETRLNGMRFDELGLDGQLLRAIAELGYEQPTPIQEQAIPVLLSGRDLLGAAQTGTGKTASFTLPILQQLLPFANRSPSPARHPTRALILAPTRELVLQVAESVAQYGKYLPIRSAAIFGGVDFAPQADALRQGVEIVIATPGRLLDHLEQKTIRLNEVRILVFDEADRMLDMGFLPDIRRIVANLPTPRQTALFSATFSPAIRKLAEQWLNNPVVVEVARRNTVSETIEHRLYWVAQEEKRQALLELLTQNAGQVLVFVDTKLACGRLTAFLQRCKIHAQAIHGDKTQQQRLETLESFRSGNLRVLVATDVAARGLDIEGLPYVINFSLPPNPEDYIHRVGRTGRAGHTGVAISLVDPSEEERLEAIEKLLKQKIPGQKWISAAPTPQEQSAQQRSRPARRSADPAAADRQGTPVHDTIPNSWQAARRQPAQGPSAAALNWRTMESLWSGRRAEPVPVLLGGTGKRPARPEGPENRP